MEDQVRDLEGDDRFVPRFSLLRLLVGVTLASIGLAIAAWGARMDWVVMTTYDDTRSSLAISAMIAWFGGGMLAGAGLFVPLRRTGLIVTGAIAGFFVQIAWAIYYFKDF